MRYFPLAIEVPLPPERQPPGWGRGVVALEARMTESWPLMLALFLPILPVSMTREILLCVEVEIRG